MSLGPGGFVILLLSTPLPFSGTFNLSVNQGLYTTLGMVSSIRFCVFLFRCIFIAKPEIASLATFLFSPPNNAQIRPLPPKQEEGLSNQGSHTLLE